MSRSPSDVAGTKYRPSRMSGIMLISSLTSLRAAELVVAGQKFLDESVVDFAGGLKPN